MAEAANDNKHNVFLNILLLGIIIAIGISFYNFYYKKNYTFFIETSCDPTSDKCFYRDCVNNPDICPPNNLSYYNEYSIKARDFKFCNNEDCTEACTNGTIKCIKKECTQSDIEDGVCVLPESKVVDYNNTEDLKTE